MPTTISESTKHRIDCSSEPVALLGAAMDIIYANRHWPLDLHNLAAPEATSQLIDAYEAATLLQGVQEVLSGVQSLFTRRCRMRLASGPTFVQVTVTRITIAPGDWAAEIWVERAQSQEP